MWKIEVTDTFGGEANYSWIRRYTLPKSYTNKSRRAIVREAKRISGFSGMRTTTCDFGDCIEIAPRSKMVCQVMFINWSDHED
jgi:hypothetical protein